MSRDRTEREYHLTPNGWVSGSFYVYGTKTEHVSIPLDRVETCIEEIEDTSGWAPPAVFWKTVWESDSLKAEDKAELYKKFPRPEHIPWKKYPKKKRRLIE